MTPDLAVVAAALVFGLVSGVHCVGMCGGVVTAFSTVTFGRHRQLARQLAYNAGRIATYSALGAAAGAMGATVFAVAQAQAAVFYAANAALVLIGLHVAGATRLFSIFERMGAPVWRLVGPHAARWLSAPGLARSFAAGAAWGFLPCGLVYAAVATSAFSGGPLQGAAAMAAFGTGTLPWLLAAGVGAAKLRAHMHRPAVRIALGSLLAAFGLIGFARADPGAIRNLICF